MRIPMRVLVIGKNGQLARCLKHELERRHDQPDDPMFHFFGHKDLPIEDRDRVCELVSSFPKDHWPLRAIINTAAWTDIPGCERDFDKAFRVNALGVQNILDAMPEGCHLYQISTDYVFNATDDGTDHLPFSIHSERMARCPRNNYGRTKRAGELIALESGRATVIRTASLFSKYGSVGKGGSNFLLRMLANLPHMMETINVDSDVLMSPTYGPWLARCILELVEREQKPPLAHIVCEGPPISWHDFAKAIFEVGMAASETESLEWLEFEGALRWLREKKSDDWPPRPRFSALENSLQHIHMGTWMSALEHFFEYEWPEVKETGSEALQVECQKLADIANAVHEEHKAHWARSEADHTTPHDKEEQHAES